LGARTVMSGWNAVTTQYIMQFGLIISRSIRGN